MIFLFSVGPVNMTGLTTPAWIRPYGMKYACHIWDGAPKTDVIDLLDRVHKRIVNLFFALVFSHFRIG